MPTQIHHYKDAVMNSMVTFQVSLILTDIFIYTLLAKIARKLQHTVTGTI